jgi:uncharacterized membrane protein (DUF2068 family)
MLSTAAAGRASTAHRDPEEKEPMTVGLILIVLLKAVTAALLWTAFVLLLIAHREDPRNFFGQLIFRTFRGNPPELAIRYISTNTEFITKTMIARVAFATSVYALVESVEAIGLILRKTWAEWLVILVTVSFIPVEVFEIAMRPNPFKVATLVANVVILWYLLKRLTDKRREHQSPRQPAASL